MHARCELTYHRHGHLVLFDSQDQLEIRHVISLAVHDIDIYAGGEKIPEGELWIKRNCIRLRKKPAFVQDDPAPTTYYLFSNNCSEKEDFYYALLRNQDQESEDALASPSPILFETDDMIKLIKQLHDSQENTQSRWLNALLGRLFLALYKTPEVEAFVRNKIKKKISRVAKPNFIRNIQLRDVDMGESGPSFMNPKLREMTVDGALTLEADVRYSGNFKAVISAVARIDLGSKLKAREVDMILVGILRRLEGHVLFKIKCPPSNRIWMTFESMPRLDISLEPSLSSRHITYGVILRHLVNRIREVFAETLVLPNWDDIPFMNTEGNAIRGGIWKTADQPKSFTEQEKEAERDQKELGGARPHRSSSMPPDVASTDPSMPPTAYKAGSVTPMESPPASPSRKPRSASVAKVEIPESVSTSNIAQPSADRPPKAMRSNSFAAAATPIVSKSPATTEGTRRRSNKGRKDAASAMKDLSSRSPDLSPVGSPVKISSDHASIASQDNSNRDTDGLTDTIKSRPEDAQDNDSVEMSKSEESSLPRLRATSATEPVTSPVSRNSTREKTKALNQSISSATVAATKWSLGMLNNLQNDKVNGSAKPSEKPLRAEPMGRGQPLPPPGMPLPKPEKNTWSSTAFNTLRRKPVNSPSVATEATKSSESRPPEGKPADARKPSPPSLSIDSASGAFQESTGNDNLMTISVPHDSTPSTPRPQTPEPDYARELADQAVSSPMTGT